MATPNAQKNWRKKADSQGRKRIEIYLSSEVIDRLDAIADAVGVSRAAVLTRLITTVDMPGEKTAQEAPPPRVETPPPPPADTSTGKSTGKSTGRRGMAKHRELAKFESDRGLVEVQRRLREQFDVDYTPAEVRDLVEPMFWHDMLKSEAEMLRAHGRTDRNIVVGWNKAGVPTLDGRGKWTQAKLNRLIRAVD